jgi:hypothetical protein
MAFFYTATGGLIIGGALNAPIITGGAHIRLAGAANIEITAFAYISSGGLVIAGGAVSFAPQVGSGGVVIGGTAIASFALGHISNGGLVTSGAAITAFALGHISNGGLVVNDGIGSGLLVNYIYEVIDGIIIGGEASEVVGYIYDGATGGLTIGGEASEVVGYIYDSATGGLTIGGDADIAFRLFYTWTGGLFISGTADAELRAFRYIARAGILLFGVADVVLSVSQYFYTPGELNSDDSLVSIGGCADAFICKVFTGQGIACDADCNDRVPMLPFFAEPKPVVRNVNQSQETPAFVPAITVCNQALWVPCPRESVPADVFRNELQKRRCTTKRFNTRR